MAFLLFMLLSAHSIVERAMDSSVVIYADQLADDGTVVQNTPTCSGFVVKSERGDDLIATAKHCTENGVSDRDIRFSDGDVGRIEGIMPSADADVAVLLVHSQRSHPAVKFSAKVNQGDRCFTIGMPSGDPWSYNTLYSRNGSQVLQVPPTGDDADATPEITFEGPAVYEGDSGAAVFDGHGSVVAVINGIGTASYPGVVYAAPISYVRSLF